MDYTIFYKDGHSERTYNDIDVQALDWTDVIMVVNTNNIDN